MINSVKENNDHYTSRSFVVTSDQDGKSIYQILKHNGTSLSLIRKLKRVNNGILLDGIEVKTVEIAHSGQVVEIRIPSDKKTAIAADIDCNVVYEDDCIIVFDKPYGMTIHPVKDYRTNTLANAFANFMAKKGISLAFRPINRLDKDTSGLAVTALDRFCAAKLSGKIDKVYIAFAKEVLKSMVL